MKKIYLVPVFVTIIFLSIFVVIYGIPKFDSSLEKLNVIVIIADDLDRESVNMLLEKDLMPNLKKHIVEKGTTFTNSFVTTPNCCPSRATFLSGEYAHNHGVLTNADIENFNDTSTISTQLHEIGYRTGFVGKYLNGYGIKLPFTYVPPGWDYWQALVERNVEGTPYKYGMYNYSISNNGILIEYGNDNSDYQTDIIAKLSSKFIADSTSLNSTRPFLLVITPFAPHSEQNSLECPLNTGFIKTSQGPERTLGIGNNFKLLTKPSFNETDVTDKPEWIQNLSPLTNEHYKCLEMVYQKRIEATIALDDLIREIVETLEQNNKSSKTMIIFTSDNGFSLGEHRLAKKNSVYEESIRVPLFIKAPGFPAQVSDKLVVNSDLAPTILEITKMSPQIDMDGKSLVPLLKNPNEVNWRKQFLIEYWGTGVVFPSFTAVRNNSYIYVEYENSAEFYNLKDDPYQLINEYSDSSEEYIMTINEFKNHLSNLRDCMGKTCHVFENGQ